MSKKPIKCFIAMAFDREDCDDLYDRQIFPLIRQMGLIPIRVDKRQHKEDLNVFIIKQLENSDIILADLTYARPSVYYEAGFAERIVPVVYTARKDHLNRAQSDDRFRVHFDLQMKKIISWSDPKDLTFALRLKKRISYLIGPIQKRREIDEKAELSRKAFLSLSVVKRCQLVNKIFESRLNTKRFWVKSLGRLDYIKAEELTPAICMVGAKMIDNKCLLCIIISAESISKKQIYKTVNSVKVSSLVSTLKSFEINEVEEHYYFCSLKKLPVSRLTSAFPHVAPYARPIEGIESFDFIEKLYKFKSRYKGKFAEDISRHLIIWLLSPLESEPDIKNKVRILIGKHSSAKSNSYTYLVREGSPISNTMISFKKR
jgi:nucleoside 2-deoxyribosyltransferase